MRKTTCCNLFFVVFCTAVCMGQSRFNVLVLYENKGHHVQYTNAAIPWLNKLAADSGFSIRYLQHPDSIDDAMLDKCQLFIQLDYPPYGWPAPAAAAFTRYIEKGKGGWLGFHHASLLGSFDGYPMWQWFSSFMGNIKYKDYIGSFADGKVTVEKTTHPVMKGIPASFIIQKEEWYTYDKSPRASVEVLASVDESSYQPASDKKMGDHPVIWTNKTYPGRNIYIFMGHSPALFNDTVYTRIFRNSIFWAAKSY